MNGHGEKFGRKREEAIAALLTCPTIEAAAKACGLGYSTLTRWLQDDGFQAAYREARRAAVDAAIGRLQAIASQAVDTLQALMADAEAKDTARLGAARTALEFALRSVEFEALESRVVELEKAMKGKHRGRVP